MMLDGAGLGAGTAGRAGVLGLSGQAGSRRGNSEAHCCQGGKGAGAHGESPEIGTCGVTVAPLRKMPARLGAACRVMVGVTIHPSTEDSVTTAP